MEVGAITPTPDARQMRSHMWCCLSSAAAGGATLLSPSGAHAGGSAAQACHHDLRLGITCKATATVGCPTCAAAKGATRFLQRGLV